ncbi:MAG: DNA replication/repair protein RecF [Firmicutes bacterium]|nr:DNA replication/repair protein RecF [Bacillota bacterium]
MVVEKINLTNFKNIKSAELVFSKTLNFLYGQNAQGKTNLLEAIYLCCVGKISSILDKDLIKKGEEEALIKLSGEKAGGPFLIEIKIDKSGKHFYLNGLPVIKISQILGILNAIFFAPLSLKLIKEAPADRRKFLDIDLSQLYPAYCAAILRYNKILIQRNNLLKTYSKPALIDILSVWDAQLIKEGTSLIKKRSSFIKELVPYVTKVHGFLTGNTEEITVEYKTNLDILDIENCYAALLKEKLEKDIALGYTSVGPHKDDLKITINNLDVKNFASQGQQRTAALSLKLSEVLYFHKITGEYPLLLLDDVLSELDLSRQKKLIEFSSDYQTLLTLTDIGNFKNLKNAFFLMFVTEYLICRIKIYSLYKKFCFLNCVNVESR